jgi:hypothetical protein
MSVLANQTNITPSNALFLTSVDIPNIPVIATGTTLISTTTEIVTVSIPGLTSTNTVVASFCHPSGGGGGAGQFFNFITPGTNQVVFNMAQNTNSNDSINWITKLS